MSEPSTVSAAEDPVPESAGNTTVLIGSSRSGLLSELCRQIDEDCNVKQIGEPVRTSAHLIAALEAGPPRVLLVGKRMFDRQGSAFARTISSKFPGMRVLLICDRANPFLVKDIVQNHFHGYLLSHDAPQSCVAAIRLVDRGEIWIPRALLVETIYSLSTAGAQNSLSAELANCLTNRESQIVDKLRHGLTNRQIADTLRIREDTVKKHLYSAYAKLGVSRRTQLMALYAH